MGEVAAQPSMLVTARDGLTVVALILGAILAIFYFAQFSYPMALKVSSRWFDNNKEHIIIKIEIESKSKVRINLPEIKLQILEYRISNHKKLYKITPSYLPFNKDKHDSMSSNRQAEYWREPEKIFASTKRLNPGEIVSGERLYFCPKDTALYIGLSVEAKRSIIDRLTARHPLYRQVATHIVSRVS